MLHREENQEIYQSIQLKQVKQGTEKVKQPFFVENLTQAKIQDTKISSLGSDRCMGKFHSIHTFIFNYFIILHWNSVHLSFERKSLNTWVIQRACERGNANWTEFSLNAISNHVSTFYHESAVFIHMYSIEAHAYPYCMLCVHFYMRIHCIQRELLARSQKFTTLKMTKKAYTQFWMFFVVLGISQVRTIFAKKYRLVI